MPPGGLLSPGAVGSVMSISDADEFFECESEAETDGYLILIWCGIFTGNVLDVMLNCSLASLHLLMQPVINGGPSLSQLNTNVQGSIVKTFYSLSFCKDFSVG